MSKVQIQHIKIKDEEGVSEYKLTSKEGCCFKDLMSKDMKNLLTYHILQNSGNKFRKLQKQNAILLEAVEYIADYEKAKPLDNWSHGNLCMDTAKKALEKLRKWNE